jgi:hypothetical protein
VDIADFRLAVFVSFVYLLLDNGLFLKSSDELLGMSVTRQSSSCLCFSFVCVINSLSEGVNVLLSMLGSLPAIKPAINILIQNSLFVASMFVVYFSVYLFRLYSPFNYIGPVYFILLLYPVKIAEWYVCILCSIFLDSSLVNTVRGLVSYMGMLRRTQREGIKK